MLTRRVTALKAASASKPSPTLPVSVGLNVMLCRVLGVLNSMENREPPTTLARSSNRFAKLLIRLGRWVRQGASQILVFGSYWTQVGPKFLSKC